MKMVKGKVIVTKYPFLPYTMHKKLAHVFSLNLTIISWDSYHYPYFTEEETTHQKGKSTCPGAYCLEVQGRICTQVSCSPTMSDCLSWLNLHQFLGTFWDTFYWFVFVVLRFFFFFFAVIFILLVDCSVLLYEIKPRSLHNFFKSPLFFPKAKCKFWLKSNQGLNVYYRIIWKHCKLCT